MPRPFDLVAAGRAYTDVIAEVTPDFLTRHSLSRGQGHEVSVDTLRHIQSQLTNITYCAGGTVANSAAVVTSLGGTAGFFGKVNRDKMGEVFLNDFKTRNVVSCCPPYAGQITLSPVCLILTTPPDRTFAFNPGCSDAFQRDDLVAFNFTTASYLLVDPDLIMSRRCSGLMTAALMQASAAQTQIAFTLQRLPMWSNPIPALDVIFTTANILFGNREEMTFLREILRAPIPPHITLVTTLDADGAMVEEKGVVTRVEAVAPSPIINTNGAGDALAAGFLRGQCLGFSVRNSLRLGTFAATAIIEETGGRPSRDLASLVDLCKE